MAQKLRPKVWEEDGGAGESTIILISLRLAGLYTPLMMDKILHSLAARNTKRPLANEGTIDGQTTYLQVRVLLHERSEQDPHTLHTSRGKIQTSLAQCNKSGLFCRVILSGPGAGGKVPDGWLMGLHQGFIPGPGRFNSSIYVPRQPLSPSIYLLPYIPDKAPQRPETDLCNKRFIVNLVLFVIGLHQLACLQKADISLGWQYNWHKIGCLCFAPRHF